MRGSSAVAQSKWSCFRRGTLQWALATVGAAIAMTTAPQLAHATNYGLSGPNVSYLPLTDNALSANQPALQTLRTGAALSFVRFFVPWDAGGTGYTNPSRCESIVQTGGNTADWSMLVRGVTAAYQDGLIPIFVMSNGTGDNPGDGSVPTDWQYACGLYELVQDLVNADLLPTQRGQSTFWVETYNEPERDSLSGWCNSSAWSQSHPSAYCDADYYAWELADNKYDFAGTMTPIGGVWSDMNTVGSSTWNYAYNVLWYLYNSYGINPALYPNWSFHDYTDPSNSVDCGPSDTSACALGSLTAFRTLLSDFGISLGSTWITESGYELGCDPSQGCGNGPAAIDGDDVNARGNPIGLADAAYDWKLLAYYAAHVFWYDLQTNGDGVDSGSDRFDSALIGISQPDWAGSGELESSPQWSGSGNGHGVPRASYCVLAFGDSPSAAVADPRCDYTSDWGQSFAAYNDVSGCSDTVIAGDPWTDWQDPVAFKTGGNPGCGNTIDGRAG
jgi:hypothetical protein